MGKAPLSELHFIQITGKLLFKTEPLLLAKILGLLSPDSYPEGPVSFSPNSPGGVGLPLQPFSLGTLLCTLTHT